MTFAGSMKSTMNDPVRIGEKSVGTDYPCLIIAEAGVNHNGDLKLALELVDSAAKAGVDAVKFQTFSADRLASPLAPKAAYQMAATDIAESQLDMLRRLELSTEDHGSIMKRCRETGLLFLSSAFDEPSVDLLDYLDVAAFKVPSGEITNLPYLTHVASKGRPLIVSTGMADLPEVETAVEVIKATGNKNLILLHCLSSYPAPQDQVNLRAMLTLASACRVPVGYSDHTEGISVACAAVAMGACVVEKHFTLDRGLAGPDHKASIEPEELSRLVAAVRQVEAALGDGRKVPQPSELETRDVARKSLVAAHNVAAGSKLGDEDIVVMRPGTGLAPRMRSMAIGRTARVNIPAGTPISEDLLV